jgi:hypothetical protein
MNWYQNYFFGYCFCCNHFGHNTIDCRTHTINNHVWNKDINAYGFSNRNYNSFAPLFYYNVVWYKCKNYGHGAHFCISDLWKLLKKTRM